MGVLQDSDREVLKDGEICGSFALNIQARHLQLLLADSYMCLPLDFPRPAIL